MVVNVLSVFRCPALVWPQASKRAKREAEAREAQEARDRSRAWQQLASTLDEVPDEDPDDVARRQAKHKPMALKSDARALALERQKLAKEAAALRAKVRASARCSQHLETWRPCAAQKGCLRLPCVRKCVCARGGRSTSLA